MKLSGEVVIEVTRKCNLSCSHCLRGPSQDMIMSSEYLAALISKFEYIPSVVFSGGEPSLYPDVIDSFFRIARELGVEVGNFYIATNATKHDQIDNFILSCIRAYLYCSDNEISAVEISNDDHHDIDSSIADLLSVLKFTRNRYTNGIEGRIIAEGNAEYWGETYPDLQLNSVGEYGWVHDLLYLNCNGEIIDGCDWSYKNQPDHKICHVSDLSYDTLTEYIENKDEEE